MAQDWLADVRKYATGADEAVVGKIVRYLGIALRNRDSSLVSFSDAKETGRVRGNFLKKKLGLTLPDAELDAAIAAVGERMKGDRTKNRVTVYYLLADYFDALEVFGGAKHGVSGGAAKAVAPAKKAAAPKKPATAKAETPPAKAAATKAPAAKATAASAAKKTTTAKAAAPKAATPKPAATKPKAAKTTAPKASAAKATLVSAAPEASAPASPPPPTPAPPVAPDAGASGVLAAANLGSGDDTIGAGKSGNGGGSSSAPPPQGGSRWWVWVLAILVLAALYFFMQSRHEPQPKPGWDANLTVDPSAEGTTAGNAGLDNAVDDALANDASPMADASPPAQ